MEKRGLLDKDERKLLGNWIFGCDICTSACPGTRIPAPFKLDLAWLLLEKDTILKKAIKNSALEYAGLKILRRNAIAVIGNNPTTEGKAIIAKFAEITQDEMLKGMSNTVLNEMNI